MSKFSASPRRHSSCSSLGLCRATTNFVILCYCALVLVAGSVNLVNSLPAESSSTVKIIEAGNLPKASTTTVKPVRHPNYVRLLKRTKHQNDTTDEAPSVLIENKESTPSSTTTTTKRTTSTTSKPKTLTTPRSPSSSSSENEKIKSIIISSQQAESTERPRGLSGLFSFLTRPRLSLFSNNNNDGGSTNDDKTNRNERQKTGSSGGKPSASASNKNSTFAPASNSLLSPGNILASVMKALQGVTITFENMVMSFVNLFSPNGSGARSGGPLSRLFGGLTGSGNSDSTPSFRITPSIDGSSSSSSSSSKFRITPTS